MNIHEHQAKKILKKYGVAVPEGIFALNVDDLIEKAFPQYTKQTLHPKMFACTREGIRPKRNAAGIMLLQHGTAFLSKTSLYGADKRVKVKMKCVCGSQSAIFGLGFLAFRFSPVPTP